MEDKWGFGRLNGNNHFSNYNQHAAKFAKSPYRKLNTAHPPIANVPLWVDY